MTYTELFNRVRDTLPSVCRFTLSIESRQRDNGHIWHTFDLDLHERSEAPEALYLSAQNLSDLAEQYESRGLPWARAKVRTPIVDPDPLAAVDVHLMARGA